MNENEFHAILARRLAQPLIVFWIASDSVEPELERDLQHLAVLALFLETQVGSIEQALRASGSVRGRWPLTLHTHDEIDAWLPPQPAVFYLRGLAHDDLPKARRQALRAHMQRSFERLVEHRPIVVALGMDAELAEVVDTVHGFDPATPLVVIGDEALNRENIERLTTDGHDVGAVGFAPSWAQFSARIAASGFSLRAGDEAPGMLVGEHRVPLYEVFEDPELRIDDRWRIITTRALNPPANVDLDQLFESFMRPDERDQATSVETDVKEWWAVASGLPFVRPVATEVESAVLARLSDIESGRDPGPVRTCWLPAESGSGTTSLLHTVAFAAARAGHPTLVLKQLVREVNPQALREFLTSIHSQRVRAAAVEFNEPPPRERCALIVLDADHVGAESIEELPGCLRAGGRQALILWAARMDSEAFGQKLPADPHKLRDFYQRALTDLRSPSVIDKSATFLTPLRARIEDEELARLQAHAATLRARGIRLAERDAGSWTAFQKQNDYWRVPVERDVPPEERVRYEAFFKAEHLFWALLYHFLRWPDESPFDAAIQNRFKEVLAVDANGAISEQAWLRGALLLEIAKVSSYGLVIPQSVLVDWLGFVRKTRGSGNPAGAQQPSGSAAVPRALSNSDLAASIERLRKHFTGEVSRRDPRALPPDTYVRQLIDDLEDRGFIRTFNLRGHVEARFVHRQLARAVLLSAITRSGVPDDMKLFVGGAAVLDPDRCYVGFRTLLQCVGYTQSNLAFLHSLSEAVLLGSEDWPGWKNSLGEGRLSCYELIPNAVRKQSRVLLHHHALVLRRTTFADRMASRTKQHRLLDAKTLCEEALALPWGLGVRDEHPGHILTSLGLVLMSLARTVPTEAHAWKQSARERLAEALVEIPSSRHARFALARMLVEEAETIRASAPERAADLASQALGHLAIAPTAREVDWFKVKKDALDIFDDDRGRKLLADLRGRGSEAGFIPSAELAYHEQNVDGAIEFLQSIVAGDLALRNFRAARRLAEILSCDSRHRTDFDERYRLLRAVEDARIRLTPDEEFQLAWLEYQRGDYRAGNGRFNIFRSTQRCRDIIVRDHPYLVNPKTNQPLVLTGTVDSIEGLRGWMQISGSDGSKLFRAPFYRRHFVDENFVVGRKFAIYVRFEGSGPRAVSVRLAARS